MLYEKREIRADYEKLVGNGVEELSEIGNEIVLNLFENDQPAVHSEVEE